MIRSYCKLVANRILKSAVHNEGSMEETRKHKVLKKASVNTYIFVSKYVFK